MDELIEVKYSDCEPSTSLVYYKDHLKPRQATQILFDYARPFEYKGAQVMGVLDYFKSEKFFGENAEGISSKE